MNSNQNNNKQSKEQQEQHNVDSNQRLAQTAVKGGATAAGAALGGAVGAKVGSKVGDVVNNSKVGQDLTRGVGNAMNTMNKFNPAGKMTQNATNKLADSGVMDLADKGIDMAANASGGAGGQSPQVNNAPTQNVNPSASNNPNTFNQNPVSTSPEPQATKAPNPSEQSQNNINKENYNPWHNSKNPSKNRLPLSQGINGLSEINSNNIVDNQDTNNNEPNDESDLENKIADNVEQSSQSQTTKSIKQKVEIAKIIRIVLHILPILIPIFLFIVIIAIVAVIFSSFMNEKNGEKCLNSPVCKTVIIEGGDYAGTYTLDEYMAGAVKYYFKDYNDDNVYAAMGIVVQSDLIRNSDYNSSDESCTLKSTSNYSKLDLIDMSNPTDYNSDDEVSESLSEDDKLDHRIVAAVSSTKRQTLTYYNNPTLEEVNMDALNPGIFDSKERIIQNYLGQTDDMKGKIVNICSAADKDQVVNYCSNVEITNGDYAGVYQFEDYVAGVVAAEVGGFNDDEVYKAFAVAARSYLLTHTNENNGTCSIENSTNFQVFRPTTNQKIIDAVTATVGEILYQDGNVVSTQYDAFCWSSKDDNYYTLKQNNQKIPVDWVEQNVSSIYKNYVCNTGTNKGHGNGMSQYGSYYLASVQGYTYDKMLTYYYRGNISSGSTGGDSGSNSVPEIISGVTANAAGFVMPLQSYSYVSCEFGAPPGIGYKPHRGTDFAAAGGTPIIAVHDGTITNRQYHNSWGNYIKIQNSDGTATLYAHMSAFKEGLSVGSTVKAGQVIGYVGSTGDSTGNHLHLEMYNTSGQLVNPRSYLAF